MQSKKHRKSDHCLNCGYAFKDGPDDYCPSCGQENTHKKIPLSRLLIEFLGDSFSFDSRIFKSLIYLILKPGFLTNEYIRGRRVPYIPPLRFFLVTGVIYFALISIQGKDKDLFEGVKLNSLSEMDSILSTTDSLRDDSLIRVIDKDQSLDTLSALLNSFRDRTKQDSTGKKKPESMEDAAIERIFHQFQRLSTDQSALYQFLFDNLSILILILLPIFALLLKIIFLGSGKWYIDHLIFSLHLHTFLYILLIIQSLFGFLGIDITWIFLILSGYLLLAMYHVYDKGIWATLFRWGALITSYLVIVGVAFILYILVAFYFY